MPRFWPGQNNPDPRRCSRIIRRRQLPLAIGDPVPARLHRKLQRWAALHEAEQTLSIGIPPAGYLLHVWRQGFNEDQSPGGLKILYGLEHEYRQLQPVIQHGEEATCFPIIDLAVLVRATDLQGLNVWARLGSVERAAASPIQPAPSRNQEFGTQDGCGQAKPCQY